MKISCSRILKDYSLSCRICLEQQDLMKSFFNIYMDSVWYPDMFSTCTGLNIVDKKKLPTWICQNCEENLFQFYKFRLKCIESDSLLTSIYCSVNTEEEIKQEVDVDEQSVSLESEEHQQPTPTFTKDKIFKCDICQKLYKHMKGLKHHTKIHDDIKSSKCGFCPETFIHYSSKVLHERRIHTKLKPYKCSNGCDNRTFFSKAELNLHNQRFHSLIKPFQCKHCSKSFSVKNDLVKHIPIHSSVLPHICDVCGKQYLRDTSLKIHKRTHDSDMQSAFPCKLCDLAFSKRHILWKHVRDNHHFDHTCEFCGKKFATADNLRKHKPVHAIKKKYSCSVCPHKSFSENHHLRRHLKDSHPGVELPPKIKPKDRQRVKDNSIYYPDKDE